ncbi:methyltransferase domain-containing protein [Alicyclobacillus tolerans]|uniref:SAM-dependent methyltransferase n=2 Tax=Alicyclobacillus tolerans TaxID=90970 RepID=A0ABT9LWL1_9BACL|nr:MULTISPECIES: methyltransferase domain-containing protein [Alicyclobacillus]MDP9728637.1 SAM-dependent methyltransferase [Alicyclobacillus tengchongensis]SHJ77918.1 Methyltransferase domain-containing protein [Alicyclobacillus montanus]
MSLQNLQDIILQRFQRHDALYQFLLKQEYVPERWLLEQTIYTGPSRRSLLGYLPVKENHRVLDIGSGFGAFAFDFAAGFPVEVVGVDYDYELVRLSEALRDELYKLGTAALHERAKISFYREDVYRLGKLQSLGEFDFAVARFLFQHLQQPLEAAVSIRDRLKMGATLCVLDIDDGMTITYPENPQGFSRLQAAFSQLQTLEGGDREIGRKLPGILQEAGFRVTATALLPQAQFIRTTSHDEGVRMTVQRFKEKRNRLLEEGIMTADEFEESVRNYLEEVQGYQFHTVCQVVVMAEKV